MLAFNRHSKIFYRPVEVALRWCLLMAYEAQILQSNWTDLAILRTTFPQWPCLHANTERIIDAVKHGTRFSFDRKLGNRRAGGDANQRSDPPLTCTDSSKRKHGPHGEK